MRERIRSLAKDHARYGYQRITALLRREGERINVKRVHRIWKSEGLSLAQRGPRRRQYGPKGEVVQKAEYPDHVWSYDILKSRTESGNKLRILTVLDEFTKESLAIWVGRSVSVQTVVENLKWLFTDRGTPANTSEATTALSSSQRQCRAGCVRADPRPSTLGLGVPGRTRTSRVSTGS